MLFFFYGYGDHRDLHSFPTRRSSDLSSSRNRGTFPSTSRYIWVMPRITAPNSRLSEIFSLIWPDMATSGTFSPLSQRRRSEEHTSELQSQSNLVCRLLLEKKKKKK